MAFALVVPAESKVFRDDLEALAQDAAAGVFSAVQVTERGWSDLRDVLSELEQRMVLGKTVTLSSDLSVLTSGQTNREEHQSRR